MEDVIDSILLALAHINPLFSDQVSFIRYVKVLWYHLNEFPILLATPLVAQNRNPSIFVGPSYEHIIGWIYSVTPAINISWSAYSSHTPYY